MNPHPGAEAGIRRCGTARSCGLHGGDVLEIADSGLAAEGTDPEAALCDGLPVQVPGGSCRLPGATETAADIAARYGAAVKAGITVQRIAPGVSGLPPLVWEDGKGLVYAVKQGRVALKFGRPGQPITANGRTWPSMGALARELGVKPSAVSKAVKLGKVEAMVARRLKEAA